MSAREWWRQQWPWLMGSALLATWAVLVPYWERKHEFRVTGGSQAARVVAAGTWGRYAGARWRVRELATLRPDALPGQVRLPAHAQVLILTLEVNPAPTLADQDNTARCTLLLRDGRGRGWRADPDPLRLYARMAGTERDCARPKAAPRIGPYVVKRLFLLPSDAAIPDLRLELQEFPLPGNEPAGVFLEMRLAGGR